VIDTPGSIDRSEAWALFAPGNTVQKDPVNGHVPGPSGGRIEEKAPGVRH